MNLYLRLGPALVAASAFATGVAADQKPLVITITGTRTAQPLEEALASTTVINREEIERSQAESVAELIRGLAGVDLTNQGGPGKLTRVFVRGTEPNHVLLLIDGVRHRSATDGAASFQNIPVSQIERIEFVRGPRSSLYGSDAIGGVIQIFTRRGEAGFHPYASAGYGSHQTRQATAGVSGGHGGTRYNLTLSHFKTDGFNATTPDSFVFEPDSDGYENNSGNLRLSHEFANGLKLDAHALRAEGRNEFDGGGSLPSDRTTQQIIGLEADYAVTSIWRTRVLLSESRDEFESKDPFFPSVFDTRRRSVEWQNDLQITSDQLLTLGVDYYEDDVDSSEAFTVTQADDIAGYAQHQARFGKHEIIAGLRHEETDIFGSKTTGNVAWGYELLPQTQLSLSYGTGFAAPTFNDLFFPESEFFVANPNLDPETSQTVELGLKGPHPWGGWDLHAFYTQIDDLIVFDPNPPGLDKSTVNNLNEAEIKGIELGLYAALAGWDINLALTLQDPEDEDTGNRLPRRTQKSLRLDLDRRFANGGAGLSLIAEGDRFDDPANTVSLDGYTLVNLRADYRVRKDLTVNASIDNLFDADYQTAAGFQEPGFEALVSLSYQMP